MVRVQVLAGAVADLPNLALEAPAGDEVLRYRIMESPNRVSVEQITTVGRLPSCRLPNVGITASRRCRDCPAVTSHPQEWSQEPQPVKILELAVLKMDTPRFC